MEVNELASLITNVGFPIAVSAYLLIRLEKQLKTLSTSIDKLTILMTVKAGSTDFKNSF